MLKLIILFMIVKILNLEILSNLRKLNIDSKVFLLMLQGMQQLLASVELMFKKKISYTCLMRVG